MELIRLLKKIETQDKTRFISEIFRYFISRCKDVLIEIKYFDFDGMRKCQMDEDVKITNSNDIFHMKRNNKQQK